MRNLIYAINLPGGAATITPPKFNPPEMAEVLEQYTHLVRDLMLV